MKVKNHKTLKEKEAYLKDKLSLEKGKFELKLKVLQFEYLGKGISFLKGFFSFKK
tara:strand:+ start:1309 stop:1473 length:165 start_codon:yes stop_codon:yes gene_type:complete